MAKQNVKGSYSQYQSILLDLKEKRYKPFYLLMGEEPYYIDKVSRYILEHILTPEEQGFNQMILYGSDVTAQQIVETARRYPMMAQRQVVVVREAQQVRDLEKVLEVYLRQAPESTILVVCCPGKSVDKRTTFYHAALAKGVVLESNVLREEEVADWIIRYAAETQVEVLPDAAVMLADYLGTDLNKISMEIDKLLVLLPVERKQITTSVVEQNVGISKEYSTFALCKALSYKNLPKAMQIVRHFGNNPKNFSLGMVLGTLFAHFVKILKYHAVRQSPIKRIPSEVAAAVGTHPFFLGEIEAAARHFSLKQTAQIIWMIRAYDGRSKSNEKGEADDGALLQELTFKILR